MTHVEDIEVEKGRRKLDHDVRQLVDKYLKMVEWDVPESDEPRARQADHWRNQRGAGAH
jgi:hypothetical protein